MCAIPLLLTACDAVAPSGLNAGGESFIRQPKVEVCHLDDDTGDYRLIEVAAPALDAHLEHGDAPAGEPVPNQDGFEFDETCQPVASVVTVDACYVSGEFQADVTVDLSTGDITSADACDFFGNCVPGGIASPVPVTSLSEITGFVYEEVNQQADQVAGGCDNSFADAIEVVYVRVDGDVFSGMAEVTCDGTAIDSFDPFAMLSEGACPTDGARPEALVTFERNLLSAAD